MLNVFNIRINRISAFATLLVWVFALVSGVANACLLEAPRTSLQTEAIEQIKQQGETHVGFSRQAEIEADLDRAEDTNTSKQPCLKACDDNSRSLPQKYSAGQVDPEQPIIVAVLWSLAEPIRLQYIQPSGTQHVESLLPLRVVYSRLAL